MSSKMHILRNVIVFSLGETSLWTGRAKMKPEDLGLEEGQLPPEAVASLGSKRLISIDSLKPLTNVRYKMRRACMEVGTKFLGGYAVGAEEAEGLLKRLEGLVAEGEKRKASFLNNFDTKVKAWQAANPEWAHIMSAGTPERESIAKRINFGFHSVVVSAPDNAALARNLIGAVEMMGGNLIEEIVAEARQFVERSLISGRDQGSQKTVTPMRRLARKMQALKFIDPALGKMADVINAVLATLPSKGRVDGDAYLSLARVAHLLANRARFADTAQSLQEGQISVADVVATLVATPSGSLPEVPLESAPVGTDVSALFETDEAEDFPDVASVDPVVVRAVQQVVGANAPVAATPQARPRVVAIDF